MGLFLVVFRIVKIDSRVLIAIESVVLDNLTMRFDFVFLFIDLDAILEFLSFVEF